MFIAPLPRYGQPWVAAVERLGASTDLRTSLRTQNGRCSAPYVLQPTIPRLQGRPGIARSSHRLMNAGRNPDHEAAGAGVDS